MNNFSEVFQCGAFDKFYFESIPFEKNPNNKGWVTYYALQELVVLCEVVMKLAEE